jgi:nitroimidazol reductase NimA-like FMN-containing flavoprotein (pyridoxamine 5'-phosphate oxidase superfamily)
MMELLGTEDCVSNREWAMAKKASKAVANDEAVDVLCRLLASQQVAVLATHNQGQPYGSLVGFAASPNLKSIFFATPRTTRKYANLEADARVALMFDDRTHAEADFYEAVGVTACGRAAEASKSPRSTNLKRYLAKHPYLKEFVMSPNCAFVRVCIEKYVIVRRFQEVVELVVS